MKNEKKKKIVKSIKIEVDKCSGCRICEMICSAFHSEPKYSSINPARARLRIIRDPLTDVFIPVHAGDYAAAAPGTPLEVYHHGQPFAFQSLPR